MLNNISIVTSLRNEKVFPLVEKALINGDFKSYPAIAKYMVRLLRDGKGSDQELLETINNVLKDRPLITKEFTSAFKVQRRAEQVKTLLSGKNIRFYLDYGCGNGKITNKIAQVIEPLFSYGTDVVDQRCSEDICRFTFTKKTGLKTNHYDLITCFTVMHHIENLKEELLRMQRLLTDDGILIIREFDAATEEDKLFNYVMDEIFYKGYLGNYDVPVTDSYFSKETWMSLFKNLGFEVVNNKTYTFVSDNESPYKPFYVMLKVNK